ncbi:LysR substrate-binding domain-containing protein [Pseudoprimorskyibacter insulae]|uniref:Glycine cleavage system transcriptional activator n=1 Tax=Pseudoprimorskyibacter insulae TaxID=1695997 RepID=A0A2R8AZ09_9RHOB|nr:LysR substrate-binding domain-containing protein [Pseudoprimorskyibacter insulae]SPF81271.1 Glycine cleavage system transcriptional activator [Pseudoprimorskyibacter insulae]
MSSPRRSLPPLTALRALEALDRLGSATAVANEQSLSQSAVSRQLQTLEDALGQSLLHRDGRNLTLTDEAKRYATAIRGALQQITDATMALQLNPNGGALNLAILPSFGMRWLVPRLPDFTRRHPDVTVNLSTSLAPFAFQGTGFDAALHFDQTPWPGTDSLLLMRETVLAVAAPGLDTKTAPLLHIQTRPQAWARWLEREERDPGTLPALWFDQFTAILQAARYGLGVALLPTYLIAEDVAAGHLIPISDAAPLSLGAYHLVWPQSRAPSPALLSFRDWMATQAEDEDPLPR